MRSFVRTPRLLPFVILACSCGRDPVLDAPLITATGSFPKGTVNQPYRAIVTISPSSRTLPIAEVVDGRLPRGLEIWTSQLDQVELLGTPTETGNFRTTLSIRVSTPTIQDLFTTFEVDIANDVPPTPVSLVTRQLPDAVLGQDYQAQLTATGGEPPYVFSATAPFAPGLSVEPSGRVFGRPTRFGSNPLQIEVEDSIAQRASRLVGLEVVVLDRPQVLESLLSVGRVGRSYRTDLTGSGGAGGPYDWRLVSGRFPPGLDLRLRRGTEVELTGIPTSAGNQMFILELTDSLGVKGRSALEVTIVDELQLLNEALPTGRVGVRYSAPFFLQNVVPPVSVRSMTGSLPGGLSLVSEDQQNWRMEGLPAADGVYRLDLSFSDRFSAIRQTFFLSILR